MEGISKHDLVTLYARAAGTSESPWGTWGKLGLSSKM
jgi:hypothetical protein